MTHQLSRWLLLAGALLAAAALPAHAQVMTVTDGTNSTSTCTSFTLAAGGVVTLSPTGCLVAVPPPPPPPSTTRLYNLSTRMQVQTGANVLIGGLVIGGTTAKQVVIRARGPSLASAGITGVLANPVLQLFSGPNVIATNDDWGSASNAAAILATGFAPTLATESAILMTLSPGPYTAIVTGLGDTSGVGIIEAFEVDQPAAPFINISTRGPVLTVNDVMIGGFIIQGTSPQTVLVRARGPSLASAGVTGALANPRLQLFSLATEISSNDDWGTASNVAQIQASGLAPSDPLESVILITLNPGAYTAIVSGVGGTTGVGIVEVFAQ